MRKYRMLGVSDDYCCELECLLPFNMLNPNELESDDFIHVTATNWGGCDKTERTINLNGFVRTGNKIILKKPLVFEGKDYDMGHTYDWEFAVKEIHELKNW